MSGGLDHVMSTQKKDRTVKSAPKIVLNIHLNITFLYISIFFWGYRVESTLREGYTPTCLAPILGSQLEMFTRATT